MDRRRGRGVHDREVLREHLVIGDGVELYGAGVYLGGVGLVHAVDVLGEQYGVGLYLRRAEHRRRIRGEERAARAAGEEHHAPFSRGA